MPEVSASGLRASAERGAYPDHWRTAALGEIADVTWGDTSTTKAAYVESGFPAYSASGRDGYLPHADFHRTGIVLSAIGANCGKTWLARGDWSCIKNTIRLWSTDQGVDTEFLYWATLDPESWPKRGSAQPFISQGDARSVRVTLPPLEEQRAIARVLGALDDKIELNRRMSETLEEMARALFRSWFVDFDPMRAKAEGRPSGLPPALDALFPASFEASELGEIPAGWEVQTLGDIAVERRLAVSLGAMAPETPYIGLDHMPRRSIALSEWGTAEGLASNKSSFEQGDILFGKLRPYFHKVGVAPLDGVCSTDIVVLSPASDGWFGFVLGHASSDEFVDYTDAGSTGTRMPRTKWKDMARYSIPLPDRTLAVAFTERVEAWVTRIASAIHESRALAEQRDALLPRLVSGRINTR